MGRVNTNTGSISSITPMNRVRKVTSIVREFDDEGNMVKETETITEYSESVPPYYPPSPYQPVSPYQPFVSYTRN